MPAKVVFPHIVLLVLMSALYLKQQDQKNNLSTAAIQSEVDLENQPRNESEPRIAQPEIIVKSNPDIFTDPDSTATYAKHPDITIEENKKNLIKHQDVQQPTMPQAPSNMHSIYSSNGSMVYYQCQDEGVRILPDRAQVTLTGNCLYVDVLGPNSQVNIQQTNVLKVSSPDAHVLVNRVDYVEVNGPNSQVKYRSTLENDKLFSIVRGPSASVIQN